ncbi:MAG: S8 family peptidase [Acidiferrobacterales bacterium]
MKRISPHKHITVLCLSMVLVINVDFVSISLAADPGFSGPAWTNRVIVKFKPATVVSPTGAEISQPLALSARRAQITSMSARLGFRLKHRRTLATGAEVIELDSWKPYSEVGRISNELASDPMVEYAEPDRMMYPQFTPNDARYSEQWHYFEATGGLNLPGAWDNHNGEGVVVAVLDTGYRPHADLNANIVGGYDMVSDTFVGNDGSGRDSNPQDPGDWTDTGECGGGQPPNFSRSSWHGTHVAGTIAAVTNNGLGVAGVAFGAKVLPVRVLGKCGGFTSDIADGIVWGSGGTVNGVPTNTNPAKILNLSLGGGGSCGTTTQNAINIARQNGATVVVAAGNSNSNAANATPANCSGVITVAATDRTGGKAFYSNFGNVVDVAAPGGASSNSIANGVLSTLNSGTTTPEGDIYGFYQGTSMATPHVAGLAALLYQAKSDITADEVEDTIKNTARAFPAPCNGCGSGIADAAAAIAALVGDGGDDGDTNESVLENGVPKTDLGANQDGELRFTLDVPEGASDLVFRISGGSGDADLYVRFGTAPTTSTFDCRPFRDGNSETCSISNVRAGTYHVMLRGFRSFSEVSLVGSYTEPGDGEEGASFTLDDISARFRRWRHYNLNVPAGMSVLTIGISGGSGDADLYVRFGSRPSTFAFNCRPYRNGNNETCTFNNPQAGTWYIGLRAFRSFSGVRLTASYRP